MWDMFDMKIALYYTGYKDERFARMDSELARVGLSDAHRIYQYPSSLCNKIRSDIITSPSMRSNYGYMNTTLGHYNAISTAYHLGCKSVLIIEDDMRFLKDLSEIEVILDSMPEDYCIAMLDCRFPKKDFSSWERCFNYRMINSYWSEFDSLRSAGLYALSRKGMECMLSAYIPPLIGNNRCHVTKQESFVLGNIDRSRCLDVCDTYINRGTFGSDSLMCFSRKLVAVQADVGHSCSNMCHTKKKYSMMGVDLNEYFM